MRLDLISRKSYQLLSASADELDSLKINLADSDTFAKAGIDRPFILGKLNFTLQRSIDSEPDVIRVSSQLPIQEPFLNFLIEGYTADQQKQDQRFRLEFFLIP